MYRARIETLEKRKMFSVTDLILDPFSAEVAASSASGESGPMVIHLDSDNGTIPESVSFNFTVIKEFAARPEEMDLYDLFTNRDLNDVYFATPRTETVDNNETIFVVAFFSSSSGPTPLELNSQVVGAVGGQEGEELTVGAVNGRVGPRSEDASALQGLMLPYIEQENIYKTSQINQAQSVHSIDTWEHAYLTQPGSATNGIIAVLIGLAVDPSNPSANAPAAADFAFADGSVRFLGTDLTGAMSLLASNEFFSRLSDTTFHDETAASIFLNHAGATNKVTHDVEFERWANASFDRGYLSPGFYHSADNRVANLDRAWGEQVQSILHEDNEFYFPRM